MGFGVAQVERVHYHANVGRVFSGLAHMGDFDQFKRRLVHGGFEIFVALPVTIGFLDHDTAFEQESFQHLLNIEVGIFGVAYT